MLAICRGVEARSPRAGCFVRTNRTENVEGSKVGDCGRGKLGMLFSSSLRRVCASADYLFCSRVSQTQRLIQVQRFIQGGTQRTISNCAIRGFANTTMAKRKRSTKQALVVAQEEETTTVQTTDANQVAALSTVTTTTTEVIKEHPPLPSPRRRTSTRVKKAVSYSESANGAEDAVDAMRNESPLTDLEDEEANEEKSPKKKRRRRKKDTEPEVYDIPPVETKETNFKGAFPYSWSPPC